MKEQGQEVNAGQKNQTNAQICQTNREREREQKHSTKGALHQSKNLNLNLV